MPRTRRQQNLVETSLEKPYDLVSGDEGDVAPPREPKISREAKTRLRGMQMSWVKRMYEYAKAFLQQGMERWETEGVGDCWLLTILAGWELNDPDVVYKVPQERRGALCTGKSPMPKSASHCHDTVEPSSRATGVKLSIVVFSLY